MAIKDIIRERREELNLTYEELGEKVGVGKSTVRKWETGMIENIKRSNIAALAKALEISPALLMGWEKETEINNAPYVSNDDFIKIPIVGSVRAGVPILATENIEGYHMTLKADLCSDKDYFYLRVQGDSMNLEFKDGSLLLIEKVPCVENGAIAVILIDGLDATVKKVIQNDNMITLIPMSSNPEHIPHMYDVIKDEIRIVGRVKQAIKLY